MRKKKRASAPRPVIKRQKIRYGLPERGVRKIRQLGPEVEHHADVLICRLSRKLKRLERMVSGW